jgi:uncharacterized protein
MTSVIFPKLNDSVQNSALLLRLFVQRPAKRLPGGDFLILFFAILLLQFLLLRITACHRRYSRETAKIISMQLSGKQVLPATPAKVWTLLLDPATLARLVPGMTRLEPTGDNSFKSVFDIKLGPVSSSFTGDLQLEDKVEPQRFTLKMQQAGKVGNAHAVVKIGLLPVDEAGTELSFAGDVRLSGLLASMGQRVIGGVANTLTKQFFQNLEKELQKQAVA